MSKTFSSSFSNVVLANPSYNPVTITSSGTITGTVFALYGRDIVWTVTNAGTVAGGLGQDQGGIWLTDSGVVSNQSGGIISGGYAVELSNGGTIVNAGSIIAAGTDFSKGVLISSGSGVVTNEASAVIGGFAGVYGFHSGTAFNAGLITASSGQALAFNYGGFLSNAASGTIVSNGNDSVYLGNSGQPNVFGTLINDGLITASASFQTSVYIGAGSLTNNSDGVIEGAGFGVRFATSPATVVNAGGIAGMTLDAIGMTNGGHVINQSGGVVSGFVDGVYIKGQAGTIFNSGSVTGATNDGLFLPAGGIVSNASTALIRGGFDGIDIANATTITNSGTIIGTSSSGVYLGSDSSAVTNAADGTIIGGYQGIQVGSSNSADNAGYMFGKSFGAAMSTGSVITNRSGGIIKGSTGVYLGGGTLVNAGQITGTNSRGAYAYAGGSVTNLTAGSIRGYLDAIKIVHVGDVLNAGTISSSSTGSSQAVYLGANSVVTNEPTGLISGRGGVQITGGPGDVVNAGTISASAYDAVYMQHGGGVTNQQNGVIVESGFGAAIFMPRGGSVTNAGTVQATTTTYAAYLAPGYTNLVVVDPGAVFVGVVDGGDLVGGTASSTLELASGSTAGTLNGLGSQFTNFDQVAVDPGASWTLGGSGTIVMGATLTALSGAVLTDTGTLLNDGGIALDPSTMLAGNLTGAGVVTIGAGSTLEVQGTNSDTIAFAGGAGYLHLDAPGDATGSVTNLVVGDTIDLAGVAASTVTLSGGSLQFSGGGFPLPGVGAIQVMPSGDGAEVTALCFCADTMILTPRGQRLVQELAAGDPVVTLSGVVRRVVWIGQGKMLAARGGRSAATPVVVRRGALAENVPNRDLRVTRGHSLFLDDVLIPVEFLVNHRSIEWDDRAQEVELYHIELESHDVLIANGAPAESYRDDGNRWLFTNANEGPALPPQKPCAPVLTGGPVVDAVWQRLLDRWEPRCPAPLTSHPDLHLCVDGRRVNAVSRHGAAHVFPLGGPPREVRVVSRASAPDRLGVARDPRVLGVALRQVAVRQGTRFRVIAARDRRLADGFHAFEGAGGLRWTDGNALLPPSLFTGFRGAMELVLHVGCTGTYAAPTEERSAA